MVHATPQFTPAQLIDAGRRAEAGGRLDLAVQFYNHLAEHFADAAEAAEAHSALGRIGAVQLPVQPWNAPPSQGGAARAPRPRPGNYRIGRALAVFFSVLGWFLSLAGLAALPVYVLARDGGASLPPFGLLSMAGGATGLFIAGVGAIFAGQIARALFDQASATRDLLALERTRHGLD